jgi:hypothetical protein
LRLHGIPTKPAVKEGTATMIMKTGELWHCTNPSCRCEVLVQSGSDTEGSNPRCVCGAPMKKTYAPPNFTYLEFLRIEDPIPARVGSRKG